jgi:hypothetical protein
MKIDWSKFEADLIEQCTDGLDEESLAYASRAVAAQVATDAIQKYHELVAAEQSASQSQ